MRKILFVLAACIFSILLFNNCSKEEGTSIVSDIPLTATISGKVFADLKEDTTQWLFGGTIVYEKVILSPPIKLIATIERKYLLDTITASTPAALKTGKIQYETTVGSDGSYSFTVDAYNKTVPVVIYAVEFEYLKEYIKKWIPNKGVMPTMEQKRTRFYLPSMNVNINRGMIKIVDLKYDDQLLSTK